MFQVIYKKRGFFLNLRYKQSRYLNGQEVLGLVLKFESYQLLRCNALVEFRQLIFITRNYQKYIFF